MATYRESPYKTARELGITEIERQKLIDTITVLLAEPEDFNVMSWGHCVAHYAGLGLYERDMSPIVYWNLCCLRGRCWGQDEILSKSPALGAAAAVTKFLSGSELGPDGEAQVIKKRFIQ